MISMRARSNSWLSLGFLFLLAATAAAQEEDDLFDDLDDLLGEEEASPTGMLRDWKGFVELKPRVFLRDRGGDDEDQELVLKSEIELNFRFDEDWSAYFRPRFLVDAFDDESHRIEPFEGYLTWEHEAWDLRIGQFVENWGIVDTFNPLDVLNRRDLGSDALDPDRLGEFGLRYRHTFAGTERFGEPTVSAYVLPFFRPVRFGSDDIRLGPDSDATPFDEDAAFEPDGEDEIFLGTRFQSTWNTSFANSDLQLIAARGPSRAPSFALSRQGELTPAYFGASTLGLGIRSVPNEDTAGDFLAALTLKAEVVYTASYDFEDSAAEDQGDYLAYVLGVDRSWYGAFGAAGDVTLTVEYAGESGGEEEAALLRPFRNDLIGRVLFESNDFARQSFELRALVDLGVEERIYEAVFERQLRSIDEDLKLTLQLQIFDLDDEPGSFFGSLENLSSIAIGLRWDF
jgi:hypothetical protein